MGWLRAKRSSSLSPAQVSKAHAAGTNKRKKRKEGRAHADRAHGLHYSSSQGDRAPPLNSEARDVALKKKDRPCLNPTRARTPARLPSRSGQLQPRCRSQTREGKSLYARDHSRARLHTSSRREPAGN